MSLWSRITNVFRSDRLNREIDEELESHIVSVPPLFRQLRGAVNGLDKAAKIRGHNVIPMPNTRTVQATQAG
jgi:hypothetical protein